jgi:branched-chain amino acid transport system substrate-binding protein
MAGVAFAPATAAEPLVINAILPLTGPAAFIGLEEQSALDLIADATNRSGGIHGRPVQFHVSDDQSNPQLTVQLASGIIAQKVPVILGPGFTATCGATVPLVTDGPVTYCFSPGIHPAANTYAFTGSVSTKDELTALARYFHARGWKRLALITSTDATGQDAERSIDQAFGGAANSGVTFVAREHFNITDISVTAQMTRIKASGAQAMIAWSTGTPFGTVLRAFIDVGMDIPIATTDGNETYAQMKQYGSFLPAELYFPAKPSLVAASATNAALPQAVRERVAEYFAAFKARNTVPDNGQSLAWDPTLIVLDAYRAIGPDATALQIKNFIESLHGFTGIAGTYDFRDGSQRGLTVNNAMIVRWDSARGTWSSVSALGGLPLKGSR